LIRLKAEACEAARSGIPAEQKWQTAVIRYLEDNADKQSLRDDRDHLLKLDPYLRDKRLVDINVDVLRPFVLDRKQVDRVANATINRALEIVRRILYMARDDWEWILRVPKIRMLKEPNIRCRRRFEAHNRCSPIEPFPPSTVIEHQSLGRCSSLPKHKAPAYRPDKG
jgi:hypothetical protein